MNTVTIGGLLETREVKKTSAGLLTKLTIGTQHKFITKEGVLKVSRTPFDVVCWGKLAEETEHIQEGSYIEVVGREQLRAYEPQGQGKKWHREVMASDVQVVFLPHEIGGGATRLAPAEADKVPEYFNKEGGQ